MRVRAVLLVGALAVAACSNAEAINTERAAAASTTAPDAPPTSAPIEDPSPSIPQQTAPAATPEPPSPTTPRPAWLGTRVLPLRDDGYGEIQPTPPELVDRRFATVDVLPPPAEERFEPVVQAVPPDVVARSTWTEDCPVGLDELRYVTLPFWGFDGRVHTGELLLNVRAVDAAVAGFGGLFDRRFPIEAMGIATVADLDAPPTGDGNTTGSFVCRPSRGSTSWSQHALGLAIDINPFHNPYVKGDVVLPELASAYVDRSDHRQGMLTADDVAGFTAAGWSWGGQWRSLKDHMHVSSNGR